MCEVLACVVLVDANRVRVGDGCPVEVDHRGVAQVKPKHKRRRHDGPRPEVRACLENKSEIRHQ